MNTKELQEHYKRVFDSASGKQVLADLERISTQLDFQLIHPTPTPQSTS